MIRILGLKIYNFQDKFLGCVWHNFTNEKAKDEDGPESTTVCLHFQMSQGWDKNRRRGLLFIKIYLDVYNKVKVQKRKKILQLSNKMKSMTAFYIMLN